jgi:hypothetical protein
MVCLVSQNYLWCNKIEYALQEVIGQILHNYLHFFCQTRSSASKLLDVKRFCCQVQPLCQYYKTLLSVAILKTDVIQHNGAAGFADLSVVNSKSKCGPVRHGCHYCKTVWQGFIENMLSNATPMLEQNNSIWQQWETISCWFRYYSDSTKTVW